MAGSKGEVQKWYHEAWTGIRGTRIVLQARKLSHASVVTNSGRHKTNEVRGTENAEAWLEIPLRAVAEAKPKE